MKTSLHSKSSLGPGFDMRTTRRRLRAVSAARSMVLACALAGCSSGSDGDTPVANGGAGGTGGMSSGQAGVAGAPNPGPAGAAGLSGTGGSGTGTGTGTGTGMGTAGSGGTATNEPAFDATHLSVVGDSGAALCRLSADRQSLLVTVANQGTTATGATTVRVASGMTTYELRLDTPPLEAGKTAELAFDRGPLAGFTPGWAFSIVIDPDSKHGAAHAPLSGSCSDLRSRAQAGMVPLNARYDVPTGLWDRNAWWNGASVLETSIDYMRETGDPTYVDLIDNSFVKNQSHSSLGNTSNFLNDYYDDEGWWSLVWIKAYDFTHTQKYLDMAKTIFQDMTGAWSDACSGGLFWTKKRTYKNAIPNELFLTIAVRLHQRTPGDAGPGSFIDWAQRDWAWFKNSGMIRADNLIVDGTNLSTCKPTGATYTYNQGVILGALADLSQATGDSTLLTEADTLAHATMAKMVDKNGMLIEPTCDAKCSGDAEVFKGVFARNLAHLNLISPHPEYRAFLIKQSDGIWANDRSTKNEFGVAWEGPFDRVSSSRQGSALDALNGALVVAEPNLALHGKFTGSAPCSAAESATQAGDGSSRWDSRWCSTGASGQTLDVDLGAAHTIVGFRVRHAGAGGEDSALNTRDFELSTSADGVKFATAVTVTGNTASVTSHPIPALSARFVRLHVTSAQTSAAAPSARIYELEVLGVGQ